MAIYSFIFLTGFIFGLLMIQLGRLHELEADRFTARHMSDPQGMIAATNKFQNYYGIHYTKEGILGNLFYRSNPYGNRLKIAQEEIDHRKL